MHGHCSNATHLFNISNSSNFSFNKKKGDANLDGKNNPSCLAFTSLKKEGISLPSLNLTNKHISNVQFLLNFCVLKEH